MNSAPPNHQGGFSLIEVVIALAIIAIAMGALINSTSSATNNTLHMQEKTLAHWVAMNKMAELQLSGEWPSLGKKEGKAELGDREWEWITEVIGTELNEIRRVDIRVRRKGDPKDTSLELVSGFFGKPTEK